jgi:uncharacterized protein YndB with AHSA1/START domain
MSERTTNGAQHLVSVQATIPVDAQRLFDLVADPAQHPRIDGSGSVRHARPGNPQRLSLGARFSMDMHLVVPYRIANTVVEFEDGRRIAWRHFYGHRWRYLFEPVEGGTLVTEQWDARPARSRRALAALGYPARNRAGMQASLARLAQLATDS